MVAATREAAGARRASSNGTARRQRSAGVPGAMRRTAYLLMLLALIQVLCPMLFANATQWWVSGGVAAGYAFVLSWQLRQRMAQNR